MNAYIMHFDIIVVLSKPYFIVGDVNVPINLQNINFVIKYKNLPESYNTICTNTFSTRPLVITL